jgi:hypothetical protein
VLGSTHVASSGSLYGYTVTQYAAYDSRYLFDGGIGAVAQRGVFAVRAGINAVRRDGARGVDGELSVAYRF